MTSISPTHSSIEARPKQTPQPSANGADGTFAQTLAAAQRGRATTNGAALTPFQQLTFLHQPSTLSLPSFVASRWQPQRTPPAVEQQTASREPVWALGVGQQVAIRGTANARTAGVAATNPTTDDPALAAGDGVRASRTALPLSAFPRPRNDNGRGIHWIPTTRQSPEVIDKYVREAVKMGIKWVTFLNDGTNVGDNDYLVKKLVANGIEPVMRIYTDGGAPIEGSLAKTVRHYKKLGVNYYQLYNEPNLRIENQGRPPDPQRYAAKWLDAARDVIAAGGLPGFGSLSPTPGLAPGAAPGDMDDLAFLRQSLRAVKALGGQDALDRAWLSVHNYGQAHLRVRDYDRIVRAELGRSMPQIGTEAGIYPGDTLSQAQATQIVADAYRYLPQREDYYFAYTYWIIANESGTGHTDAAWNHQALFRPDGRSPLVDILTQEQLA